MNKHKVVSLFSGAGGMDLGFEQTGRYKVVLANDILPPAVETYVKNFNIKFIQKSPDINDIPAVMLGDINKLHFDGLEDLDVDILVGGPPCQDFSIIRGPSYERRGLEVKRGRLYSQFIRALAKFQPKVFIFENVTGLKSANEGLAWNTILSDFKNLSARWNKIKKNSDIQNSIRDGSDVSYRLLFSDVVDMSKLGIPQKRKRVMVIGIRNDISNDVFSETSIKLRRLLSGEQTLIGKFPLTPIEVFEGKPLTELETRYREIIRDYKDIWNEVNTQKSIDWKHNVWDKLTFNAIEDYLKINKIKSEKSEIEEAFEEHRDLLKELGYYNNKVDEMKPLDGTNIYSNESFHVTERMRRIPPDKNHEFVRGTKWEVEGRGMSLVYRRLHPLKPAYTVVAYGGGGTWTYHYERSRSKLTSRERARLQAFPDSFLFEGNISEIRAQIGEAVPPLLARRIAEVIDTTLKDFN